MTLAVHRRDELLGTDFQGAATTDRYPGYARLDRWVRQVCWAHLLKAAQTLFGYGERLKKGALLDHELVSGMCRAMRKVEASMWTFVRVEGVEPTNDDAEREARHGVIYRKLSYGTQIERLVSSRLGGRWVGCRPQEETQRTPRSDTQLSWPFSADVPSDSD